MKCQLSFPFQILDDQVQDLFGSCNGDPSSVEAIQKLCIAAVFYLDEACRAKSAKSTDDEGFSTDPGFRANATCLALASLRPPKVDDRCRERRYCEAANATLVGLMARRVNDPVCSLCALPEGEGLCKLIYYSVKFLASSLNPKPAETGKETKSA